MRGLIVTVEVGAPLLLLAFAALTIGSRRVVSSSLTTVLALLTLSGTVSYLAQYALPLMREGWMAPVRIEVVAATAGSKLADGTPAVTKIQVFRGSELIQEREVGGPAAPAPTIALPQVSATAEPLRLEPGSGGALELWRGKIRLGELPRSLLTDAGWLTPEQAKLAAATSSEPKPMTVATASIPAAPPSLPVAPAGSPSQVFVTKTVFAGSSVKLGEIPGSGPVFLDFVRLDRQGYAVVTLRSDGLGEPNPISLQLDNKKVTTQLFGRDYRFDVGIHSANFGSDSPWAAFAVVLHR